MSAANVGSLERVVVLFIRSDSHYKTLPGVDCYDIERDATTWPGGCPVVAHPPCRSWGVLAHMAFNVRPGEKELGPWAIEQVRRWGGVLEHPAGSRLFAHCGCAVLNGFKEEFGGISILIDQFDFGHVAHKPTLLYIVGCAFENLPPRPEKRIEKTSRSICGNVLGTSRCTQRQREETPPKLAEWLIETARRCSGHNTVLTKNDN